MASRDDIDRVKAAVNILDVVTPYVSLKRAGAVWKGLCPFHAEKTPSFQVNPDKGVWYCFGQCSTGGDIFKFTERIENLSFGEALERLASRAGITLTNTRDTPAQIGRREAMVQALDATVQYYQQTLAQSEVAQRYLAERGISAETQRSFRLGYAGETFDGLAAYLRARQVDMRAALEAGVLASSDRNYGTPYDKMRGRVVCPIFDIHDRPIAFGGRLMADEPGRPKYLNTAETPLFSKGRTFFAMGRARKSMAEQGFSVIVEGYFDVISAHQAGFENVVATLGTSLSADHADMLKRHVQRVVLAFDADAAGVKAAQRAHAILEAKQLEVLVLDMPAGEDPDSLIRSGRAEELRRAIDGALPVREFQLRAIIDLHLRRPDLSERDRAQIFRREIVPVLRSTASVLERERYIRMCAPLHPVFAQGSAMAEDEIRQEVDGRAGQGGQVSGAAAAFRPGQFDGGRGRLQTRTRVQAPVSAPRSGVQASEEILLAALMGADTELAALVQASASEDLFTSPAHGVLARRMLCSEPTMRQARASEAVEDDDAEVAQLAARLLAGRDDLEPISAALILDAVDRLRREQTTRVEKTLRSRADLGDEAALRELMTLQRRMHGGQGNSRGQQGA